MEVLSRSPYLRFKQWQSAFTKATMHLHHENKEVNEEEVSKRNRLYIRMSRKKCTYFTTKKNTFIQQMITEWEVQSCLCDKK